MLALLLRNGFGHLGCSRDDHPYVVPMHYAFDSQDLYFSTTQAASVSLPRSSICSDERPTSTLKSPGSARHFFELTS